MNTMNTSTIPTSYVLKTAKAIKLLAYLIAVIGTIASYGTQVHLLLAYEVGAFSWVIPATVDLLAICAALALQLPDLDTTSRKIAGTILTVAVVVSVAANVTGGHNPIAKLAHAWPVVAYLLGELLANRVRAFAARLVAAEAAKAAAHSTPQPPAAVPVQAPVSPGQPPVAAPTAATVAQVVLDDPAALAFRAAQAGLRRTSRLARLNPAQ